MAAWKLLLELCQPGTHQPAARSRIAGEPFGRAGMDPRQRGRGMLAAQAAFHERERLARKAERACASSLLPREIAKRIEGEPQKQSFLMPHVQIRHRASDDSFGIVEPPRFGEDFRRFLKAR